jgi:hypothetical protein
VSLRLLKRLRLKLSEIKLETETLEKIKSEAEEDGQEAIKWFHQEVSYGEMVPCGIYKDVKLIPEDEDGSD